MDRGPFLGVLVWPCFFLHGVTLRPQSFKVLHILRPGDGLADIVFGFIFKRVLGRVVEQAASIFEWASVDVVDQFDLTLPPPAGLSAPPFIDVVWADDLAFSAMHEDAEELVNIMTTCTALIFKQVLNHGMIPNLKAGKTELLFSLRGRKSRAVRQRIFNVVDRTIHIDGAPEGYQTVRLTAKYRHLDTQVESTLVSMIVGGRVEGFLHSNNFWSCVDS